MTTRQSDRARLARILRGLEKLYPEATCELDYRGSFELLVATILSAQCTDKKVNEVTPALFARWPDAPSLAAADASDLQALIRPTGFFRMKARNLQATAGALVEHHGAQVPRTMADLVKLPGVARKTANVVLGTAFGIADGVVVDTHVARLSQRLALSRASDPGQIERDLMDTVPRTRWIAVAHRLIWHGRRVCFARNPQCDSCALAGDCPAALFVPTGSRRSRKPRRGRPHPAPRKR